MKLINDEVSYYKMVKRFEIEVPNGEIITILI